MTFEDLSDLELFCTLNMNLLTAILTKHSVGYIKKKETRLSNDFIFILLIVFGVLKQSTSIYEKKTCDDLH